MIKRSKSKDRVPLLDRLVNFHLRKCEEPFQGQKKRSGHTEALQSGIQMEGRETVLDARKKKNRSIKPKDFILRFLDGPSGET